MLETLEIGNSQNGNHGSRMGKSNKTDSEIRSLLDSTVLEKINQWRFL